MNGSRLISVAVVAMALAACGGNRGNEAGRDQAAVRSDSGAARQEAISSVEIATPEMVDGVQVVRVTVADTGYTPSKIRLKQGVPARIIFDQHSDTECASHVKIPSMNVAETALPKGKQTAVEFTPGKNGEFTFTCGMDMMEGSIVVES
jgi:plastocyanin domain-containing protein